MHSSDLVDESEDNLYSSEHSGSATGDESGDEHPPTPERSGDENAPTPAPEVVAEKGSGREGGIPDKKGGSTRSLRR